MANDDEKVITDWQVAAKNDELSILYHQLIRIRVKKHSFLLLTFKNQEEI